MKRPSGTALPFALSFVMVVFFIITVQTALVNYNLRLVQGTGERTRLGFLAREACNEAIARMNEDPTWTPPPKDGPYAWFAGDDTMTTWVEPDPGSPDVLHVRGRAFPTNNEGAAQDFTRIVVKQPPIVGVVFSTGASRLGTPTSIFRAQAGSPDWELLPVFPNMYYDTRGNVKNVAGDFGTMVGWVAADQKGNAYSVYYPRLGQGFISQLAADFTRDSIDRLPRATELMTEHGRNMDQYGSMIDDVMRSGDRLPSILQYSSSSNTWTALPPLPATDSEGNVRAGEYVMAGMPVSVAGGKDNVYAGVVHQGKDSIYEYDRSADQWNVLSRPQGMGALRDLTADAKGNVFAQWAPSHSSNTGAFYQYDGTAWTALPPPPRQFGSVNIPADARIGQLTSSPKGELIATWWGSASRPDTVIKYSAGAWSLVDPPPAAYYDSSGTLVTDTPRQKIDFVGVDGEGSPVVKYPHQRVGEPDTVYRKTDDFKALSPLPDKGYTKNGTPTGGDGFSLFQGPLAGGGAPSTGGAKYTPVSNF